MSMNNTRNKYTKDLIAPTCKKEFTKDWARRIIIDFMLKNDPEWIMAQVLKVQDVMVKENPHPGMLSESYVMDVSYTQGDSNFTVESWFVKVPKSLETFTLDQMEIFMYDYLHPLLQTFASNACGDPNTIQMPIPLMYHCAFDEELPARNILVMENLRDQGYKPLRPETCGLVFMRAAMTSLATIHATAFGYQTAMGGKLPFLSRFPLIKEDNMPRAKHLKPIVDEYLEAYLEYLGKVAPDIAPQIDFLKKFHKFLLGIFHDIQRDKELWKLKIMVHGDSKVDNFMFKKKIGSSVVLTERQKKLKEKNNWAVEDEYIALIIDWQGVAYDLLSGDIMWTLYGFMKNLPEKNSTVDSFMDYSIAFYHRELLRLLELMKVDKTMVDLPTDDYDATMLIRKGFLYGFLKTMLFKPILKFKGKQTLKHWFDNKDSVPLPDEKEIFKSGTNFVNYIHLQITMATEVGVFQDLAQLCIQAMKEAIFGQYNNLEDSEDEAEKKEEEKENLLSEMADILNKHEKKSDENKVPVEEKIPEKIVSETQEQVNGADEINENEVGDRLVVAIDVEQCEEKEKSDQEVDPKLVEEESKIDASGNFIIDKLKFWCNICKRDLLSDGAYKIHNKLAHRGNIATQDDTATPKKGQLFVSNTFWCSICEKELNSKAAWDIHKKFAHPDEPDLDGENISRNTFWCSICETELSSKAAWDVHKKLAHPGNQELGNGEKVVTTQEMNSNDVQNTMEDTVDTESENTSMIETGNDNTNTVKEQQSVSENIDKVEDLTSSQEKSTSKIADLYQKIEDSVKSIEEPRRNSAGNNSLPPPPNGAPPNLPESVRIESSSATDDKPTTKKKKKYGMKKKKSDISKLP